uniref:Protein phosphatase 1 regulatory subunit 15A/B C-terminal domain-containing protein n=1 Tax=Amphiprion percula TaxID=161767 RepID=A0A3P8U483_AMPPE
MFRNVRSEGHLSGGHSPASSHGHGVSSPGLVSQESSWIGLLSRPALALLQNILTGPRVRCPALAEKGPGWLPTDLNSSFVNEENEFLRQLHDMMPPTQHLPPHLSYLRCDRGGPLEPRPGGASQLKARTLEEEPPAAQQDGSGGTVDLSAPQCQNKVIAFIMGCPCSDDDSSQSDGGDDDGFNSEGSSDLSESTGEDDDEDSELEVDSESERLWSSLCQSHDPYNPQNFTARLQSGTGPRSILGSMSLTSSRSSSQSSPASSISSSPPSGLDVWEDSASASEADEAESLRLWSSFSSSDPYSPFNFQAPLRTQGPAEAPSGAQTWGKKASMTPRPAPAPEYRREEPEERLDISRDRCRFLRRCQEVEQSISYVFAAKAPSQHAAGHGRLPAGRHEELQRSS